MHFYCITICFPAQLPCYMDFLNTRDCAILILLPSSVPIKLSALNKMDKICQCYYTYPPEDYYKVPGTQAAKTAQLKEDMGCLATWYLSLMPSTDFSDTLSDCLTTLALGCFLNSQWVWCPHRLFLLPALVTSFVVVVNFSSNLVNLQSTTRAMPMAMLPIRHLVLPLKTNQENSGMVKRREEMSAHSTSCQLPWILHSGIHFGWEMLLLAEKTMSQKPHSINSRTIERGGWALPR